MSRGLLLQGQPGTAALPTCGRSSSCTNTTTPLIPPARFCASTVRSSIRRTRSPCLSPRPGPIHDRTASASSDWKPTSSHDCTPHHPHHRCHQRHRTRPRRTLRRVGGELHLVARNARDLESLQKKLQSDDCRVHVYPADLSKPVEVTALVTACAGTWMPCTCSSITLCVYLPGQLLSEPAGNLDYMMQLMCCRTMS